MSKITNKPTNAYDALRNTREKDKLKLECLIRGKENEMKKHVWIEAYLVYLHKFPPEKASILADEATNIYTQRYNGEI